jgi:SEC-C motif-containing protein
MEPCPCGSGLSFEACCRPIIAAEQPAETAEALMRSRYSAFAKALTDHIWESTHPEQRREHSRKTIQRWSEQAEWLGFEILSASGGGSVDEEGQVEFVAAYREKGARKRHHEVATFKKKDGRWYFYDGDPAPQKQVVRDAPKVGRNDPCQCGSGKKYKKCCGR